MTVSTIGSIAEFDTNGVTTNYPFYFKFLANDDLVVTYVNPAGVSSVLTLGTNYTVNGAGNDQGGSIVTTSALAGPGQLTVSREMDAYQQTSLRNQGKFLAETHEDVFDKLTMLIQQGFSGLSRALKRPIGKSYFDAEGRIISNLAEPVSDQDAATKGWAGRYFGDLIDGATGLINTTTGILYDAGTLFDHLRYGVNRSVDSIAALRLLSSARNQRAFALGYHAKGDGGGGAYFIDQADVTSTDNGGTIIVAADGARWKLTQVVPPSLRQFGCKGDGSTDDTVGYLAAVATGMSFHVPKGDFKVSPVGASAVYPGPIGFLRTSSAILSSGQTVSGEGDDSILRWGSATIQAFFLVKQAVGVRVNGIRFIGGHSSVVIDPVSDGAVDSVWVQDCAHEGQAMGICGGRQIALDPTGSKSHTNFHVTNCRFKNMPEHSIMVSNCNRYQFCGNDFRDSTGGFCIDQSQGSRGGMVHGNTGDNVLYFTKIESTNPAGGTQETSASTSCSVINNIITRCTGYGLLVNSITERVFIHGNTFQGSLTQGIKIDAATGYAHDGQIVIANNIVRTGAGGTALRATNIGQALLPPIVVGNHFYGSTSAIDWLLMHGRISNNVLFASGGNVINLGGASSPNITGLAIIDNEIRGDSGIVSQNYVALWTRVRIEGNDFRVSTFAIYAPGQAGIEVSRICRNKVHYSATSANHAIQLNKVSASQISDNDINMPSGSTGNAIVTFTTTLKSRVADNISTRPNTITSPDASTTAVSINNITDAAYAA